MDYEQLLKRAREQLPEQTGTGERFEIPKAKGRIEGNKTVVTNFKEIVDQLRRDQDMFLKYLQRELAVPASIDGPRLVLNSKIKAALVNSKIELFAKDFVICKQCGKPDTQLQKHEGILVMKCAACGAKNPVKSRI